MIKTRPLLALAIASLLLSSAQAATDLEKIKAQIIARFPDSNVQSVAPSAQIPGWYEVLTASELVYANADASRLFVGRIIDTTTKQDLTAQRLNALRSIDFATLPLDLAIKVVHGDGSRKVAVFSDPLCPYCQKLESELAKVDNVTVYTFLYPLESVHPGATVQAGKIWCSADRPTVWTDWMLHQKNVGTAASCDTQAITTLLDLGTKMRVDATPTLYFADGHRVGGVIGSAEIEQQFGDAGKAAHPKP